MIFGESEQMTQDLMHDEGVTNARDEFVANGGVQSDRYGADGIPDPYPHKVDLEAYYRGFIFKASWTTTFIGSYSVEIRNNGDGTATYIIRNTTGVASLTHIYSSNYDNPTMQTIVENFGPLSVDVMQPIGTLNQIAENYLRMFPVSSQPSDLNGVWNAYVPSGVLNDIKGYGPGGNIYQVYTWTEKYP